ncbi:MAG: hypothetical protein JSV52_06415 [Candidatus Zixiibacteriota bacterium]|nr:MAG: hypothetical protein JSV52_06415 [candidate division Zixibacteria bacterium]
MRLAGLFLVFVLFMFFGSAAWGQSIWIEDVEATNPDGTLKLGETIEFVLHVTGDEDYHRILDNGFRVYSPDGAEWTATVPDTVPDGLTRYITGPIGLLTFSCDGSVADTVGFVAMDVIGTGMPPFFDEPAYTITIGPIDSEHAEKTIIVDSSSYPPVDHWIWGDVNVVPDWGGPYEYTIGDACPDPFTYADPGYIVTTTPIRGFVDIYFGNFCEWGKDVYDVDLKSVKVDAVKPRTIMVVQQDPVYGGKAIRATVALKNLLKPYEPLTGDIELAYTVSGKFLDKTRFEMIGDLVVHIYPGADLNADGITDNGDVDVLMNYLFHTRDATPNDLRFDVDGSGRVDLLDVVALKKIIADN